MANKKVSQLTSKPSVLVTDLFPIADPTTGQLFKTTISALGTAIGSGVSSVNTLVGAVVLDTDDIQELASPTNRWYTDTRSRAAISGGTGISYNSGTGVITNAVTSGQIATALGYTPADDALVVKLAGSQTITGTKTFQQAPLVDIGVGFKDGNGVYNTMQSLTTGWQMPVNGRNHNLIFSTASNYVYTFPNASGTIALTSDLSAYLPLAGGTMTGAIVGTTATFTNSGSGIALGVTQSGASGDGIRITHSLSRAFTIQSSGSGFGILINNDTASTSAPFTIQKNGLAKVLFSDLGVAEFAGSITASSFIKSGGTSAQFLKADGSIDSSTYLTTSSASSTYVPYIGANANLNMGSGSYGINSGQYLLFTRNGALGIGNSAYLGFLNATSTDGIYVQLNASNGIGFYGMTSSVQTSQVAYITRAGDFGANSFIKIGGTSAQFLKADGSIDSSTYLTTVTASSTYLPLSGGTLTGNLNSNSFIITTQQFAVKKNSSGTSSGFYGLQNSSGINRWNISIDNSETGSGNTGFDFNIYRYDDAGSSLASAFSIRRSDGLITNTGYLTNLGDITIGNGTADRGLVLYANNGSSGWAGRFLGVNSSGEIKVQHRNNSATYTDVFKFNANGGSPTTEFFGKTNFTQVSINTSTTSSWLNVYDTGSRTNSIDLTASGNSTKGHIGQFNNKLYISSNWFYNGSQNADSTSFGQAAIVFDTQNAGGGTQLDFQTSEIGATTPVSRMRISVNGTARHYLDQGSNNQFVNFVGTQSGYSQEWGFGIVNSSKDFRLYDYTAGVERVRFDTGGNMIHKAHSVGQGILMNYNGGATYGFYNNNAGALTLTNSGVANVGSFNMSTGVYTTTSDINKKKDFEESTIGLNEILQLKPILYRMKTDETKGIKELGFIAQEVKEIIPNAYVQNDDFIGLNFNPIVAALTKAVQELEAKIKILENK